jgi:hypothetical protein
MSFLYSITEALKIEACIKCTCDMATEHEMFRISPDMFQKAPPNRESMGEAPVSTVGSFFSQKGQTDSEALTHLTISRVLLAYS